MDNPTKNKIAKLLQLIRKEVTKLHKNARTNWLTTR
jgi:hypothetical protein